MITLLTFLRGGLYSSLETFKQMPEGSKLIATVNNQSDADKVEELGGEVVHVTPWAGGDEWSRHRYVRDLWNAAIPFVDTDRVILCDDDVVVSRANLYRLIEVSAASCVCGIYPYRDQPFPGVTLCPVFYSDNMRPSDMNLIPKIREKVFCASMGFSIWKTPDLKSCLPVEILDRFGSPAGTELDASIKLKDKGKRILIDGRVICQHLTS